MSLSLFRFRQAAPHFEKPVLQLKLQVEFAHVGAPLGGALQPEPQLPQLAGSVLVSTQLVPHWLWPEGQFTVQLPFAQTWPVAQALPHAPQLAALV